MRIVVAGAHGQVARRLGRLLTRRGDTVLGIVRNPGHRADLEADGVEPVVLDLEHATVDDVAEVVAGADAVVFSAGGGPGSGIAASRPDCRGPRRAEHVVGGSQVLPLLVSSTGVESVAGGATPDGVDEVFVAYLRAKLAAEQDVLGRPGLDVTVLRPGVLTDGPGTLDRHVERGEVPRDDVAAVLAALLDGPRSGAVLELVGGDTPVADAVAGIR